MRNSMRQSNLEASEDTDTFANVCSDVIERAVAWELATSTIEHQVTQPLAAITMDAETCLCFLDEGRTDVDRARRAARRIVINGQRASEILRSFRATLAASRLDKVLLDINDVIADVLHLMHEEVAQHQVRIDLCLGTPVQRVLGDRVLLQQVVMNIVRNGIEAMDEESIQPRILRVSSQIDAAGMASIAIEDSGIGLDSTVLDRIF